MKLLPTRDADTGSGLTQRMMSENGTVEIGVYPDPGGARIRGGFAGAPECEIDWCCGDSRRHLESHYIAVCLYLMRREENENCFVGLPRTSNVEPCWEDNEFEKALTQAMLTIPGVYQSRPKKER